MGLPGPSWVFLWLGWLFRYTLLQAISGDRVNRYKPYQSVSQLFNVCRGMDFLWGAENIVNMQVSENVINATQANQIAQSPGPTTPPADSLWGAETL